MKIELKKKITKFTLLTKTISKGTKQYVTHLQLPEGNEAARGFWPDAQRFSFCLASFYFRKQRYRQSRIIDLLWNYQNRGHHRGHDRHWQTLRDSRRRRMVHLNAARRKCSFHTSRLKNWQRQKKKSFIFGKFPISSAKPPRDIQSSVFPLPMTDNMTL